MTSDIILVLCTIAICTALWVIARELHQIGYVLWHANLKDEENPDAQV